MNVSNFELIFKKQSPAGPSDTVLQGYFLEISNLEDTEYLYTLDFVTSSIANADRSLFQNTVVFVDTPSVNNSPGVYMLNGTLSSSVFTLSRSIAIPAHGTALVALLPSDPFSMPGSFSMPNFECRGYVRLRLPAVRGGAGFPRFFFRAQSSRPVKVMLTPQFRATYLTSTGTINDQTQSSVPTATGSAVNDLPPDQPELIKFPPIFPPISPKLQIPEELLTTASSAELLAALLAQVQADPKELAAVNGLLAESGVGIALSPQKPRR